MHCAHTCDHMWGYVTKRSRMSDVPPQTAESESDTLFALVLGFVEVVEVVFEYGRSLAPKMTNTLGNR